MANADSRSLTDSLPEPNYPLTRIRPESGWMPLELRDLWNYRELLVFLAWRDISVRYKQTVLGAAWAVIQPFFGMVIFSIFFGNLAKIPSDGIAYPLFVYTALVPWTFFANGIQDSSNSLVGNANLLTKVYFPRLIIPMAAAASGILDFCIAFVVLLVLMLYYGYWPGFDIPTLLKILWLPIFVALTLVTALGTGLWLSALNVQFRDVRYVIPFLIQFWLFATPVAYPSSLLKEPWHTLYGLNPMVGVVEGFRWALLPVQRFVMLRPADLFSGVAFRASLNAALSAGPLLPALFSAGVALVLVVTGAFYFRRVESIFADVV